MAQINGQVSWGIVPLNWGNQNLAGAFFNYRGNYLKSVHDKLRYQIQWHKGGLTESVEAVDPGDIVSVTFDVEVYDGKDWNSIGKLSKLRDISNKRRTTGTPPSGHRFTIDISSLLSNELSYSLCPIGKGTWQSNQFGGMNGGITEQDNVLGGSTGSIWGYPINYYNVSENGTFRLIRVGAKFEILDSNLELDTASTSISYPPTITVINSVNQFEKDRTYYATSLNGYLMQGSGTTTVQKSYRFLTRCNNYSTDTTIPYKKPIRTDDEGEFLQFYLRRAWVADISGTGNDKVGAMGLKVETFDSGGAENTFYLNDFEGNADIITSPTNNYLKEYQDSTFIQNVSAGYITSRANLKTPSNSGVVSFPYWTVYSGSTIGADTLYYRVSVSRFGLVSPFTELRLSEYRYYTIDREDEKIPYGFVRFHWLNSMGGIDSYTAKRDVSEGLTISRDVIERSSADRTWMQDDQGALQTGQSFNIHNSQYNSDSMRGGNLYKGGREVLGVQAERNLSVYTEPLNYSVSKWLEEMMLSPNVWVEMDTDATDRLNNVNPHLRPSTKGYIPVIITNSDVETVNQAEGLVKFNIEYILAHKVITQRN